MWACCSRSFWLIGVTSEAKISSSARFGLLTPTRNHAMQISVDCGASMFKPSGCVDVTEDSPLLAVTSLNPHFWCQKVSQFLLLLLSKCIYLADKLLCFSGYGWIQKNSSTSISTSYYTFPQPSAAHSHSGSMPSPMGSAWRQERPYVETSKDLSHGWLLQLIQPMGLWGQKILSLWPWHDQRHRWQASRISPAKILG